MKKRGLALFLCLALLCTLWVQLVPSASAANIVYSGACGDSLTWTFDTDGVLTISGNGSIPDCTPLRPFITEAPWADFCPEIRHLVIKDGVTSVGAFAFWFASSLEDVRFPESLVRIGDHAFWGSESLAEVYVPAGVTTIEDYAFGQCWSLSRIRVAEKNANYCSDALGVLYSKDMTTLVQVPPALEGSYTVPNSVLVIAKGGFFGSSLTSVTLPEGLTTIEDRGFANNLLTHISLPKNVATIGEDAFDAYLLQTISVAKGNAYYASDAYGVLYSKDFTKLIAVPHAANLGFYTLPETLTELPDSSFSQVDGLTGIVLPKNLTAISEYAFYECKNLTAAVIGEHVASIGTYAFADCYNLQKVYFYGNAPKLGADNFAFMCYDSATDQAVAIPGLTLYYLEGKAGWVTPTWLGFSTATWDGVTLPAITPFSDIKPSEYYADAVAWAVEKKITNGTSATTFSPDETCTRGQIVTFLWRAAGEPKPAGSTNPFTDVKASEYYYNAVLWAVEQGITTGTSATTFSPNDGCTRGQVATFLWRFAGKPTAAVSNPFADVKAGTYYYDAILWAVENGITNGTSATTFEPESTCTRGQIVTFLYRCLAE